MLKQKERDDRDNKDYPHIYFIINSEELVRILHLDKVFVITFDVKYF